MSASTDCAACKQRVAELRDLVGELRKRNNAAGAVRKSLPDGAGAGQQADPWGSFIRESCTTSSDDVFELQRLQRTESLVGQVLKRAAEIRKAAFDANQNEPTPGELKALSAMLERKPVAEIATWR